MRKVSYVFSFIAVTAALIITILSARQGNWIVVKTPEVLGVHTITRYGLMNQCTETFTRDDEGHDLSYVTCRKFPRRKQDNCEEDNTYFCTAWTSAGYFVELSIGFCTLSLLSIAFGVSTGSRRRRIWKAVAGLTFLFSAFQLVAFALITDVLRNSRFPTFEWGHYGLGYFLNIVAWVIGVLTGAGVIITGVSANKGKKWAAGNRAYRMIPDRE